MFSKDFLLIRVIFWLVVLGLSCQGTNLNIRITFADGSFEEQDLLTFIKHGKETMKSYHNLSTSRVAEKVVLVLGVTGSGKSTLINYLNDVPMVFKYEEDEVKYVIKPVNETLPGGFEIGHKTESKTLYPAVYTPPGGSYSYVDNPGFDDNRGVEFSIANGFFRKEIAERAHEFKFLLLIPQSDINNRGNDFRHSINAMSKFLGIFDDEQYDDQTESNEKISELANSIAIVVTKVEHLNWSREKIKKSLLNSLLKIVKQEKEKKSDKRQPTQMEDVFEKVLVNKQLEIFPVISNFDHDTTHLEPEQKFEIVTLIEQKLSYISKEKAKVQVKLEDKVDVLKSYLDDKYAEFKQNLETVLVKKSNDTTFKQVDNFLREKSSQSLLKTCNDLNKIASIILNENVTFSNIEPVLVNFTKINDNILNERDLDELNEKVKVFKYLIDLLPKQEVDKFMTSKVLDSVNLIKTLTGLSLLLTKNLTDTILSEREKLIAHFQALLLAKVTQQSTQVENDFEERLKLEEPGKTVQNTIDFFNTIITIITNQNITLNDLHQFVFNLTSLNPKIIGEPEDKDLQAKLNNLRKLTPPNDRSYLEIPAFDKALVLTKFQQLSSGLSQKLADTISDEKAKFTRFFEPFLLQKVDEFVRVKLTDLDTNAYLDGEGQINKIISDFTKLHRYMLNSNNFSLHKVNELLDNTSNFLTTNERNEIHNKSSYLVQLLNGKFLPIEPLVKLVQKTNDLVGQLNEYMIKYRDRCQRYEQIIFYSQYPTAIIVLKSKCNVYRTLERKCSPDSNGHTYDHESTSLDEAFRKRSGCRNTAVLAPTYHFASCSKAEVRSVIDYNQYFSAERCFPNALLAKCGAPVKIENGLIHCEKGNYGCCNTYHSHCCCWNADSQRLGPYKGWDVKKRYNCFYKFDCGIGFRC